MCACVACAVKWQRSTYTHTCTQRRIITYIREHCWRNIIENGVVHAEGTTTSATITTATVTVATAALFICAAATFVYVYCVMWRACVQAGLCTYVILLMICDRRDFRWTCKQQHSHTYTRHTHEVTSAQTHTLAITKCMPEHPHTMLPKLDTLAPSSSCNPNTVHVLYYARTLMVHTLHTASFPHAYASGVRINTKHANTKWTHSAHVLSLFIRCRERVCVFLTTHIFRKPFLIRSLHRWRRHQNCANIRSHVRILHIKLTRCPVIVSTDNFDRNVTVKNSSHYRIGFIPYRG